MDSIKATKPHAVCVPYPSQGHVTPMMDLAKLLHAKGFHITFVNTEFNHKRLIRASGPEASTRLPYFRFETIPDGLPPSDRDATQDVRVLSDSIRKTCLVPFVELLHKLNSSVEVPPVSCIVSDGVMSFGIKAAEIIGVPEVQFWTASACGFMAYLQFDELVKSGILPFKVGCKYLIHPTQLPNYVQNFDRASDLVFNLNASNLQVWGGADEKFLSDGTLNKPIDWVPGMSNIRFKDMPSYVRTTDLNKDIMFDFMGSEAQKCLTSPAIIFNTFDELEHEVLEAIASMFPNIYTTGPLPLLCSRHVPDSDFKSFRSSLWKEDTLCLEWLDKQEPNSAVYVNYGSVTVMTEEHLIEFAWGLANSKHPFLWIVRPDVVMGTDSTILPEEYFEEIKDRGLIVNWCPQEKVLAHPAVGVFLTHCGWNSIIESISAGVPVICWPFFADQQTNCRYACATWGIGMEVDDDVKRGEVEKLVKEMLEGKEGKKMKENALEWKKKAVATTDIGGKSYRNFDRFIKEALHYAN